MPTNPAPPPNQLTPSAAPLERRQLLPYQQRWLADRSDVKVIEKSRRIGITWAEAADAVLTAADQNGGNVFYVGYNYDLSKSFIEDVEGWARYYQLVAKIADQSIWEPASDDAHFPI